MLRHSLDVVKDVENFVYSVQTLVVAFDQSLFNIAKKVQFYHHNTYCHVMMMTNLLNTEMAFHSYNWECPKRHWLVCSTC